MYFLPYLMGERSPHNDPAARGAFIGMTMDIDAGGYDAGSAGGRRVRNPRFAGVARSLGLQLRRSKTAGGGRKARVERDIRQRPDLELECVETEEGPGYGGAILAAVACGVYASVREAAEKLVRVTSFVKPTQKQPRAMKRAIRLSASSIQR